MHISTMSEYVSVCFSFFSEENSNKKMKKLLIGTVKRKLGNIRNGAPLRQAIITANYCNFLLAE